MNLVKFRRRRKTPRGFVPASVDVTTLRMQCDVCGTPVDVIRTSEADTPTGTDAVFEPCGHSVVPDYRP